MPTSLKPIILREQAEPGTPPAGSCVLYSVDGSALLLKDEGGTVRTIGPGTATGTKISNLTTASALDGTEQIPVVQGGTTKKTTVADLRIIDVVKTVGTRQTNTTTTGASITDLAVANLAAGTYRVSGLIVMQSSVAGDGFGLWVGSSGGTVTKNVGTVYTQTTGGTATTGVADQATVAATFQMMEGRSWRANNTDPGPFGGVDTINSDQLVMLEALVVVTATTTLQILFDTETAGTTAAVEVGSSIELHKVA